jgi:stress response protein YsnF
LVEAAVQSRTDDDRTPDKTDETDLPLLAEEVTVSKQVVETGRVQVARVTREHDQLIDELLARDVGNRPDPNRPADETMPAVRDEGDTVVIPIVEQVLVIERRLLLKEEVRVRPVRSTERHQESDASPRSGSHAPSGGAAGSGEEVSDASAKPQHSKQE